MQDAVVHLAVIMKSRPRRHEMWSERAAVVQLAEHLRDFNCEEASGVFDQVMKQCSSWVPGWLQVTTPCLQQPLACE